MGGGMRKFSAIFILVTLLIGCSRSSSPSKAVKNFYQLVEKGEVTAAYEMISVGGKRLMDPFGGKSVLIEQGTEKIKETGGIKDFKIISEDVQGEIATEEFIIIYGNGSKEENSERLIKEDGKWKIDPKK
jgi:hypothetical protein